VFLVRFVRFLFLFDGYDDDGDDDDDDDGDDDEMEKVLQRHPRLCREKASGLSSSPNRSAAQLCRP